MISRGRGGGSSGGGPVVETGLEVGEVTVRSLTSEVQLELVEGLEVGKVTVRSLTSEVQLELVEVLEVDCIPPTRRLVGD